MSKSEPVSPLTPAAQALLAHLADHRTHREFKPDRIPQEHVELAVCAAQQAATSSWIQAYRALLVTRPKERKQIATLAGGQVQIEAAGAFFVVCADNRRHRLVVEDAGDTFEQNFEVFLTSTIDATLFAQNLVLAFEAMGYGTCFIGALRNDAAGVARVLELPQHVYPLFGLCVGVPASDPGQRPRLPLDAVVSEDRVPNDAQIREQIQRADGLASQYYQRRNQPKRHWSGGILRRFRVLARPELPDAYRQMGARLE